VDFKKLENREWPNCGAELSPFEEYVNQKYTPTPPELFVDWDSTVHEDEEYKTTGDSFENDWRESFGPDEGENRATVDNG
jgi:hypothetical protein